MNALVCDLKRCTVHDGPGLRTTLFLKGCSLHCIWCHNPESIRTKPELGVFQEKCVKCHKCAETCCCHTIVGDKHLFDREKCNACGRCVAVCRFDALELYGRKISVEEAAKAILEDKDFYEVSGGGVTLSGGEPLLQIDFCIELFKIMKQAHVHTAVESCGNVPWAFFERILPLVDMFLYDFKHFDSAEHEKLTGRGNDLIKCNLLKLSKSGVPIEIRMPLAPGLNMDDEGIKKSGAFLRSLNGISAVRLLPCHLFGQSKAKAIGMNALPFASPNIEEFERVADILRTFGLKVNYSALG